MNVLTVTLVGVACLPLSPLQSALFNLQWVRRDTIRSGIVAGGSGNPRCGLAHPRTLISNLRLAAALSHELNTPLGTLKSAVQTMTAAALKLRRARQMRLPAETATACQCDLTTAELEGVLVHSESTM